MQQLTDGITRRETWGYVVWGSIAWAIAVPEFFTAFDRNTPWVTFTETLGHLSGSWKFIVLLLILSFGGGRHDSGPRTPMGRANKRRVGHQDVPRVLPVLFASLAMLGVVACSVVAALIGSKWAVGYSFYGSLGFFFVVIPSALAYWLAIDVAFPTFSRTLANLDRRLPFLALIIDNTTRLIRLR